MTCISASALFHNFPVFRGFHPTEVIDEIKPILNIHFVWSDGVANGSTCADSQHGQR